MNIFKLFFIFIATFGLFSCGVKPTEVVPPEPQQNSISEEESIEMNRFWVRDESFKIDQFVKRHNWDATTTESGVRYYIYQKGNGVKVEKDMLVAVSFEVRLLDADTSLCYSSNENGIHTILVERDDIESGLHEALKYMHVGDKAFVILPHFAAHGLIGDNYKIPPLSPVLYKIEVLDAEFPE